MRTVCGFLVAILLPAAALAQSPGFAVWERPAAGVMIGPSANADEGSGDRGADVDFVFDTPVVFGYRLRADASRVGWRFESPNASGLPPFETVTVKSIRLSALKVQHMASRVAGLRRRRIRRVSLRVRTEPVAQPVARRPARRRRASKSRAGTSATRASARCAST